MAAARTEEERTERPTPARQREARRLGHVAASPDLSAALALAAVLVVFAAGAPAAVGRLLRYLRDALAHATSVAGGMRGDSAATATFSAAGEAALAASVPVVVLPALVLLVGTVLFGAVQTGGLFAWAAARPRGDRLSPRQGLRRLFSGASAGTGGRALLKMALVFAVVGTVLFPVARALPELARARPDTVLLALGVLGLRIALRVVVALVVWGIMDWVLARWRHQRELAMTKDEVRREETRREGDPRRRAERRRLHRALGEQPPLEDVAGADVVVAGRGRAATGVGPGLAVAVAYRRSSGRAPVVTLIGRGPLAERMEELARAAAVTVHHDDDLAAVLAGVTAGDEIPERAFDAVAALLRPAMSSSRLEGPRRAP